MAEKAFNTAERNYAAAKAKHPSDPLHIEIQDAFKEMGLVSGVLLWAAVLCCAVRCGAVLCCTRSSQEVTHWH
jgi:hypothetical protein